MKYWTESLGRIELQMTMEQAELIPLSGHAEFGVALLIQEPDIKAQVKKIDPKLLATCLSEYGAWNDEELKDHSQNIDRLLWLAACDIQEEDDNSVICNGCKKTVPEHGYCDKDGSGYGECCWGEHAENCESCKDDINNA